MSLGNFYNPQLLKKEDAKSFEHIEKDGAYIFQITRAFKYKSNTSLAEALVMNLVTSDNKTASIRFFYKNKNGEALEFGAKKITDLIFLLNLNINNLDQTYYDENNREGLTEFINKKIGILLKFDGKEEYIGENNEIKYRYNYTPISFIDPDTKKTAYEKANNKNAEKFYKFVENCGQTVNTNDINKIDQDDDFPF